MTDLSPYEAGLAVDLAKAQARIEELEDKLDWVIVERATPAAMTPEVQALMEAAEPLAAMASRYDPEDSDGNLECWSGLAVPKIKHIRALRAALAALR